jgi:hypothetical protein
MLVIWQAHSLMVIFHVGSALVGLLLLFYIHTSKQGCTNGYNRRLLAKTANCLGGYCILLTATTNRLGGCG